MKKVLITGSSSYIGTSLKRWLGCWPEEYKVDSISVRNDDWKKIDFSIYDTVVHTAAIVHKREKKRNYPLYEKVNHQLAVNVYKKCEESNVKQFIFLSTAAVYAEKDNMYTAVVISEQSKLGPYTEYGKSKYNAESELQKICKKNGSTKLAIVRSPLVYGPNCRGNYILLSKFAKKVKIIPNIKNQRSMIFIDNLSEFIRLLINGDRSGIFLPQNKDYICTTSLIEEIAHMHNHKIYKIDCFNWIVKATSRISKIIPKVYGDNVYQHGVMDLEENYNVTGYVDSIRKTEFQEENKK